ncbi:DUF4214 domain-containing protein [Herbaspirillum sp. GCM10030257]|uniref:DUF4214 domain-containing protein n=1 Tax=Herbaspirillum sp. GCM10030257 TaxID=3273393 RepID=UPI003617E0BB
MTRFVIPVYVLVLSLAACGGGESSNPRLPPVAKRLANTVTTNADTTFPGKRSDYTITQTSSGFSVADNVGDRGVIRIGNADTLRFADVTINLNIASQASAIPEADLNSLVELYVAFFNRVPDASGLSYWISQYQSGVSLVHICESFYNAAVQYSALTGYSSTMSNADFVKVIYKNVLGRSGTTAPPDADVQYWANELASGRATKGSLVKTMLASAHSFTNDPTWGWVTKLLDNKIAVGKQVAVQQGLNYNTSEDSITKTMAIAAAITPTDTSAALANVGITEKAYKPNPILSINRMRAVHMYSNYGDNVRGVKPALSDAPQSLSASGVTTDISRSSYTESSGNTVIFDTATVKLSNVKLGGGASYAQAGFALSRRADNGELSLDFSPSVNTSLAAIQGFAGNVHLQISADGKTVNQWTMINASGAAREYIAAVVAHAAELLAGGTFNVHTSNAVFNQASLIQAIQLVRKGIQDDDSAYFNYLRDKNVEWLALTVPIFYGDVSDPTVKLQYRPAGNMDSGASFTFDDADLIYFLNKARKAGFKIMLGLELSPVFIPVSTTDPDCKSAHHKVNRWLLGQPTVAVNDPFQACINPAYWWWDPVHPDHAKNTEIFWNNYTDIAVKYARIAQQTGVEMYAVATEQDNLVRTRASSPPYTNHFKPQLTKLVSAVRAQYSGLLTYDQQHITFTNPEYFAGGAGTAGAFSHVFEDLDLDVVGTSAYFELTSSNPGRVLSVAELETVWENIFKTHLVPRQAANPGKPLVFTEFGYTDDVGATALQGANLGMPEPAPDASGVTPGQQQQKNIFQAFFNVNSRYDNLIRGAFIWGVSFISPYDCSHIVFGIYCKASADTVKQVYGTWKAGT